MLGLNAAILEALLALQWILLLFLGLLILGAFHQIARLQGEVATFVQRPSRLRIGDHSPSTLDVGLPPRAFVIALLAQGCGGCVAFCQDLQSVDLGEWAIVAVLFDWRGETDLPLPTNAQVVYDPDRRWSRELGTKVTPTVLAFVNGRLVAQEIGPKVGWLLGVVQSRSSAGKEVLQRTA